MIEDASLDSYKNFFHKSRLLEFGHNIIAFDADHDDIMNVISNWCFYEISASIYVMSDNVNWSSLPMNQKNHHHFSKKELMSFLEKNSSISIHQELDYTVNICCKKNIRFFMGYLKKGNI